MRFFSAVLSAIVLTFAFAFVASAQCTLSLHGFRNIGTIPNNPFQAEFATTTEGALPLLHDSPLHKPELVARDSQGRVRVERVAAKYRMDSGPDQGQELEQHLIYICDPVAKTLVQIDTVNRTAKITHFARSGQFPANLPAPAARSSICAARSRIVSFANSKSEDLGNQTILGLEAHGTRLTLTPAVAVAEGRSVTTTIQDQWCSDDLDAIILTSNSFVRDAQTTRKSQTSLSNLQRTEPDAALFQIPPDYTISELVPNSPVRRPGIPAAAPQK